MSPADAHQYLPRISRSSRCTVLCYAVNAAFVLCREFGQFRWPSYTFLRLAGHHSSKPLLRGEEKGSKSPFFQLSEPVSPSSLLLISSSRYIQFNSPYSQLFFFSFLRNFPPYFSRLPTIFRPFLPPPYSVPPPPCLVAILTNFQNDVIFGILAVFRSRYFA